MSDADRAEAGPPRFEKWRARALPTIRHGETKPAFERAPIALLLLVVIGCASTPVIPVGEPRAPIAIGEPGTPPVYFEKVVYRLPIGYQYRKKFQRINKRELGGDFVQGAQIETANFNILATDRMVELGYSSVDPTEGVFEDNLVRARFRIVGVVTALDINRYLGRRSNEDNYETANLTMEVRLYDAAVKDVVYRRSFEGIGFSQGYGAAAQPAAILNALEGALEDPAFVAKFGVESDSFASSHAPAVLPSCRNEKWALPADVETVSEAVVTVRVGLEHGSGVLISPRGHLLTAAHVVTGSQAPVVRLEGGEEFDAEVLRLDKRWDVALLKIPGRSHKCASIREQAQEVELGDALYVIGSPLDERLSGTLTAGILSGRPTFDDIEWLQTDASVSPGSSGGPLMDRKARVVGLLSMKSVARGAEGIAFAVPIASVIQSLAIQPSSK